MRHAGAQRTFDRQRRTVGADRDPRLLHRQREIRFVDDEIHAADRAALLDQQIEDEIEGIFPGLLRRLGDAHAFILPVWRHRIAGAAARASDRRQLHVLPGAGRLVAALPRRIGVFHLLADARALPRILQARDQPVGAAVHRPRRNRRGQARAAGDVRILIGGDADTAGPRRFDHLDHFLHAAEVLLAGDLEVEDVNGNLGVVANRDRFADAVAKLQAVVAQVRRVQTALLRGGLRDFR